MARSYPELLGLQWEAERMVRAGDSRAEVARILGVHPQTLAGWALRGGWRKKDLDLERSGAISRRTIARVKLGHDAAAEGRSLLAERAVMLREALELLAQGGPGAEARIEERMARMAVEHRPALRLLQAEEIEVHEPAGKSLGEYVEAPPEEEEDGAVAD